MILLYNQFISSLLQPSDMALSAIYHNAGVKYGT